MDEIRIHFCDFFPGFRPEIHHIYQRLSKHWELVLDDENPDYVIYSCFGRDYLNFDCIRIFYTGENLRPDFNFCDYAIGFDTLSYEGRYLRYPYALYNEAVLNRLLDPTPISRDDALSRKFCNFIYSNGRADPIRDHFFKTLSEYKHVDSLGRHLNNMPQAVGPRFAADWAETKLATQREYKFTIAFENSLSNGYTTEKLPHALVSQTVPIYWGNPRVVDDFNPEAYINVHDYASLGEVVEYVRHLDSDDAAYLDKLNAPAFTDNKLPEHLENARLYEFFEMIFGQSLVDAQRRPKYGYIQIYEERLRSLVAPKKKKKNPLKKLKHSLQKRLGN